jgi:tetratricopeptide (TPR) repeat protein
MTISCRVFSVFTLLSTLFLIGSSLQGQSEADIAMTDRLIQSALKAQESLDRTKLDSLAEQLLIIGKSGDQEAEAFGNYFKSDALCRTRPNEALALGQKALQYFDSQQDKFFMARVNNVMGHSMANAGSHSQALEFYNKAINYSYQTKENEEISEIKYRSRVRYNAGFTMLRRGDLTTASQFLSEAYEDALTLKDSIVLEAVLNQLGNIEIYRNAFDKGLVYHKQSYEMALLTKSKSIIFAMTGMATCYQKTNQIDSALYYHQKVFDQCKLDNNITCMCVSLNNTAELYYDKGHLQKAMELADLNLEMATKGQMPQYQLLSLSMLNNIYMGLNQPLNAVKYIDRATQILNPETEFAIAASVYEGAAKTYEQLKEYDKALSFHKLFKESSDTLLNQQSIEKIDKLKIELELKEKEQQIAALQAENELDTIEFRQRIGMLIGGLILLGLASIIIYIWMNKRNLKIEKEKENIEQRLLRSQLNPHFIFNAISSIQNYLFDKSDLKVGIVYLSRFAHLMRQILENSREQFIPLCEEIKALENYLELQKLRYGNDFEFKIIVDKEINANDLLIPPLIAQPFVENAIEHGMIYRVQNGQVTIAFESQVNSIQLSIKDNGVGGKPLKIEPKSSDIKKTSLATKITKERLVRLSKMHKQKYDLVVNTLSPNGTLVVINLPKIMQS